MRPGLPLAIRVKAHIILARGKDDYVYHAEKAVGFAAKGVKMFGPGSTPEARAAVDRLVKRARSSLRRVERDLAEDQRIRAGLKAESIKKKEGHKIIYGGATRTVLPCSLAMTLC